jgi:tetratricopeptide (TPR) repeat protein
MVSLAALVLSAALGPVLVLPPEAEGGPPAPWAAELVADQLPRSLSFLGVPAIERADRLQAHAALEIPLVAVTRATSIRMAEALGASRVVTGSYAVEGGEIAFALRLLDVERGTLSGPLNARGPMDAAADLVDALAWDIALAVAPPPTRTRDELLALRRGVPFEAVKTLAEGLAARGPAARIRTVRRALTLAPSFHAARLTLGRMLLDQREFTAAHETLNRIPRDSPLDRGARFLRGVALLEVGRYREAAALYAALAEDQATPAVLNNRALALLRDGDRETRAADVLRQALAISPESQDLAFNLGWSLLAEGDPAAASFTFRDLVARTPLDRQARLVLAWSLGMAGREGEANEEWKAVAALAPGFEAQTRPDLTRRFERILRSERPFQPEKDTRTPAELAATLLGRAQRLNDAGDVEGALREAMRSGYLDPYNRRTHLLIARLHRRRGDHERALNEFRMALWSEDDAAVRVEVAQLLREMGREEEARIEAQKALKLDPANPDARRLAGGEAGPIMER